MDKPKTVMENDLLAVLPALNLPKDYREELCRSKDRIIKMLKAANWSLTTYRSWEKQQSLDSKMPIPSLDWAFRLFCLSPLGRKRWVQMFA